MPRGTKDIIRKKANTGVRREWYKVRCIRCDNITNRNPKFFTKPDPLTYTCSECQDDKFNKLSEYGISL